MRLVCSAQRFSRAGGALIVLFLSAQFLASAPNEASPQAASSAPAQSQSQTQSAPTCSDAPPIMKRGKQADLPPCPEPAVVPPAPGSSAPGNTALGNGAPPPARPQTLIERARDAAFEFSANLPNFICQEFMARYAGHGRDQRALDIVSAEIIYTNGQESYRNVKIDNRATQKNLQEIGGSWSTGEFASTLLDLFAPNTNTMFHSGGLTTVDGHAAEVFDFQVRKENSHWQVETGAQKLTPAYEGSVWVDPKTARALRIEIQARDVPSDFPLDSIETAVDYSDVMINGATFLLPVHAENLGCQRANGQCDHNVIDFRNYHEFKVDVKIVPKN